MRLLDPKLCSLAAPWWLPGDSVVAPLRIVVVGRDFFVLLPPRQICIRPPVNGPIPPIMAGFFANLVFVGPIVPLHAVSVRICFEGSSRLCRKQILQAAMGEKAVGEGAAGTSERE